MPPTPLPAPAARQPKIASATPSQPQFLHLWDAPWWVERTTRQDGGRKIQPDPPFCSSGLSAQLAPGKLRVQAWRGAPSSSFLSPTGIISKPGTAQWLVGTQKGGFYRSKIDPAPSPSRHLWLLRQQERPGYPLHTQALARPSQP